MESDCALQVDIDIDINIARSRLEKYLRRLHRDFAELLPSFFFLFLFFGRNSSQVLSGEVAGRSG